MDAVILCGGESRRIGANKAFLLVCGRPIIERQMAILRSLFDRILLATRTPQEYVHLGVEIVKDEGTRSGSLVGIWSGLRASRGPAAFFVACDMPFLNPTLIKYMVDLSPKYDVVIPQTEKGLEPTHAIYSKSCLPHIESQVTAGQFKIINFFSHVRVRVLSVKEVRRLDPSGLGLVNINTPEDYKRYSIESSIS